MMIGSIKLNFIDCKYCGYTLNIDKYILCIFIVYILFYTSLMRNLYYGRILFFYFEGYLHLLFSLEK